jgi:hypothetical protein
MIGVCATLIGLVKLAEAKHGSSHVDEYAAMAAVTFLASALTSYLSIRYSNRTRLSFRIERIADVIFLAGLIGITLAAGRDSAARLEAFMQVAFVRRGRTGGSRRPWHQGS